MNSLIVDDSSTIRKIIRKILEELGFSCAEAEDGNFAVQECEKSMPDIIFLDWNMPNMNGLEFLKHLRLMDGGSKPKVIFCTTENTMEYIQEGLQAGADEYIMKPFDKMVIETKLTQMGLLNE